MRSFVYGLGTIAFFGLLASAQQADAACGVVEVSKGNVRIQSGQTKKISTAAVGGKICSGDRVVTGADSRAKLKMEDGNELNISPESQIVIENYEYNQSQNKKKVLLNVLRGKVRAATKQENMYNDKAADGTDNTFQVKTRSAVAGVRGTDFLTSFDASSNKTEVVTFKGRVEVGQLGQGGMLMNSVSIDAGQKAEVIPGQAPAAPQSIPQHELQQMNTDSQADAGTGAGPSAGQAQADVKPAAKEENRGPASQQQQGSSASTGSRAPASMIDTSDLGGDAAVGLDIASGPEPIIVGPNIDVLPKDMPQCQQCMDAVQNSGPSKVNVRIRLPGQ